LDLDLSEILSTLFYKVHLKSDDELVT